MTIDVFTNNTTVQNASEDNQYSGMSDTKIRSGSNSGNNYNASNLSINKYGGVTDHDLVLIKFAGIAANIDSSAIVSSAIIFLETSASNTSTFDVDTHRLLSAWTETTATFDDGDSAWNTGGARGDGSDRVATATATTAMDGTVGNWSQIDVTADVQDIVDGTISTDHGWMNDRTTAGNDSVYIVYVDSEGTDGSRPELVVTYTIPTNSGKSNPLMGCLGGPLSGVIT